MSSLFTIAMALMLLASMLVLTHNRQSPKRGCNALGLLTTLRRNRIMAAADLTAARKRKRIHYDDVMMWACGLLFAAAISLLVWTCWAIWSGSRRPTFELKRDDWTCSKTEPISQLQLVGKVLVPMTINVCVEYERKQ